MINEQNIYGAGTEIMMAGGDRHPGGLPRGLKAACWRTEEEATVVFVLQSMLDNWEAAEADRRPCAPIPACRATT